MSICSSKFTLYLALLVTIRFSILVGTIEEQQQKIRNIGDAINKIIYIFNIVHIPYTYTQRDTAFLPFLLIMDVSNTKKCILVFAMVFVAYRNK